MKKSITISVITSFLFVILSAGQGQKSAETTTSPTQEVKIGNQIWMSGNLDVERFRNGDIIPQAQSKRQWRKAGAAGQPAWCYYGIDPVFGVKYGKLYNWYAVVDPRGLAPEGWHIPSEEDWDVLTDAVDGKSLAGLKLKSKTDWKGDGNGNNISNFNGLPGGFRNAEGIFEFMGEYGKWWSSKSGDSRNAWCLYLYHGYKMTLKDYLSKSYGLSVRCIKD